MRRSESGNVLFYILIAVALLAALSYAISNSTRDNATSITDQRAHIYATDIIEFANAVSNAVSTLRLRGCSDTEISFENNIVTGYTNGTNTECQVFHPNGGGVNYNSPNEDLGSGLEWNISGSRYIHDVGTTGSVAADRAELYINLEGISEQICIELNDMHSITNPSDAPPVGSNTDAVKFTGSYAGTNAIVDTGDSGYSVTEGHMKFCMEDSDGDYVYVQVLLAR